MPIKLYYFALPGLAEASRLMLTGSNIEFEDVRLTHGPEWDEFKPKTPFGQVPVLEVDGTMIAQSRAIENYCAKLAGYYPEDPLTAAFADMAVAQIQDSWADMATTFKIQDEAEKIKARQDLLAGSVKTKMSKLDAMLAGKDFVAGEKLSFADFALFTNTSLLKSGMIDGIPTTIWDDYPNIKAIRNKVAQVDFVAKYYADETEGIRCAFKPDA